MSYFEDKLVGKKKSIGAFNVRRALPRRHRPTIGPFIFFDHMGPATLPPDANVEVRPHPHIGLATVTYLFEGAFFHRDSLGNEQRIVPGDVNWMTAGGGIVHSERTPSDLEKQEKSIHGLQLWVALPTEDEDCPPSFTHYDKSDLPQWTNENGVKFHLLIGTLLDRTSPVKTFSKTLYVSIQLPKGSSLELPKETAEEIGAYVISGEVNFCSESLLPYELGYKKLTEAAPIKAIKDTHLVIIGGDTFPDKKHIWWNFVSSSQEKIEEAKKRWKAGKFPPVPNETEFIPLPEN